MDSKVRGIWVSTATQTNHDGSNEVMRDDIQQCYAGRMDCCLSCFALYPSPFRSPLSGIYTCPTLIFYQPNSLSKPEQSLKFIPNVVRSILSLKVLSSGVPIVDSNDRRHSNAFVHHHNHKTQTHTYTPYCKVILQQFNT